MGGVFDYFDEVRQIVETAVSDVLFIDPYLDAEFVARYLPHVKAGVTVRLLGQKGLDKLLSAVDTFAKQHGTLIQVRSGSDLHDRWVILDGAAAYQSGSSFKDGAKKSPTTVTQLIDAFGTVRAEYEARWAVAQVHR